MTVALLDINVLLALAWPNHMFHLAAHRWFDEIPSRLWATCALTELGFIRLSSNPSFHSETVTPKEATAELKRLCRDAGHHFWPSPTAADPAIFGRAKGHQQVNDAWLVELTRLHKGVLATFDKRLHVHDPSAKLIEVIPTSFEFSES
jgi:uncharacterized protein